MCRKSKIPCGGLIYLVSCVMLFGLVKVPSAFAGIVTSGLIQDLDADVGITASGTSVSAWANQAPSGGDDVSTNGGSPQLVLGPNNRGSAVYLSGGARLAGTDASAFLSILQGSGHTWFAVVKPDLQNNTNKNAVFGMLLNQSPWSGVCGHVGGTAAPVVARYMVRPSSSNIFIIGTTDLYDGEWHIIGGRLAEATSTMLAEAEDF